MNDTADKKVEVLLIEDQINANEDLVDEIKKSAETPSKPMSPEEFKKWLDQQH